MRTPLRRSAGMQLAKERSVSLITMSKYVRLAATDVLLLAMLLRFPFQAVVDALHLRRYALLGISQGVATAITHAVRYPDRVTKMAVIGGFALGRKRGSTKEIELERPLLLSCVKDG